MENHRKGSGMVGIIIIGAIIWAIIALFSGNSSDKSSSYSPRSTYSSYNSNQEDSEYYAEPENPYNEGSGHSAGYEWAEENDVDSCGGNSNSFIEGCEEYVAQKEQTVEDDSEYDY